MRTPTLVPVEEYLKTFYRPDCDYVDGVVEERTLGESDHGWIQARIAICIGSKFKITGLGVLTETRMQVKSTRFRIPDIMVTRGRPTEQIITKPPLLCIEILSPEDRLSRVKARIEEYLAFGVPTVWVVDPQERSIQIYRPTGVEAASDPIQLESTEIVIPFSDIFD